MKKILIVLLIILGISGAWYLYKQSGDSLKDIDTQKQETVKPTDEDNKQLNMTNPASDNCIKNGGDLEIITNTDGSQFGLCKFEKYSCEEWALYRGECNIEADSALIRQALIAKGLNLTNTKVVIRNHFGKYIGGSVVPVETGVAGGGYVFAVKEDGKVKILADGNGGILCSWFSDYPDFPTYLVSECGDANWNMVTR